MYVSECGWVCEYVCLCAVYPTTLLLSLDAVWQYTYRTIAIAIKIATTVTE